MNKWIICAGVLIILALYPIAGAGAVNRDYFIWSAVESFLFSLALLVSLSEKVSKSLLLALLAAALSVIYHLGWWLFVSLPMAVIDTFGLASPASEVLLFGIFSAGKALLYCMILGLAVSERYLNRRTLLSTAAACALAGIPLAFGGFWGFFAHDFAWLLLFTTTLGLTMSAEKGSPAESA